MALYVLYFLSGAAGLVLEAVFLRQATWLFGSAATATALVLAAFMGGLAAGSAALGPAADRTARPLRLYGLVEIGTGLSGALLAWVLGSRREALLATVGGTGLPGETILALAILLLPTALMGASLPVLGRLVVRDPRRMLRSFGTLYGINTLGGAVGALAAGFWLFENVGVSRSGWLAGGLDVAVGAAALALDRLGTAAAPPGETVSRRLERGESPTAEAAPAGEEAPVRVRRASYVAAALGGGAVLGYEVVWTRLLSLPMRSYAYSFSLMLALFLLGLVLGSLALASLAGHVRRPAALLAWIETATGLYVASSLLFMPPLLVPAEASGFGPFLLASAARASLLVLPPTILSGMALPLAARVASRGRDRLGRGIGGIYAVNTAGAIGGALLTGLALLPALGAPRSLAVLALVNAAAGAVVVVATGRSRARRALAAGLALACGVPAFLPETRFLEGFLRASRGREKIGEVLLYREGSTDTIAIVRKNYGFLDPDAKSLITNGVAMSATVKPVWRYMAMEGHLPVLLAARPSRGIVICLGTGITLGAVASHPRLGSIDAVELSEGVIEGLRIFDAENGGAYRDPRVRLVRGDGRHFLETSRDLYDVVTLEPPPPIVAGSAHLYSRDFYEIAKRRLAHGGVVAQWLPLHAQSLASARMAARTFLDAFPHVQLWLPSIRDAILVGSDAPIALDVGRLRGAYAEARTAANLKAAYLETPEAFLATFLLDRAGIERWVEGAPAVTDERPLMEFFRSGGETMKDGEIATLATIPQAGWDWVRGLDAAMRASVVAENEALRLYLASEIASDPAAGLEAARRSRGTEFYLYRMGCASAQRAFIEKRLAEHPEGSAQLRRCESLQVRAPAR
jgi:spermidine synthase